MEYIIAKKEQLTVKLGLADILYIGTKTDRPRVLQFVTDDGIYESYGKIKDFEEKLGLIFKRCHRKYLVNLRRVRAIDMETRQLLFDNGSVKAISCSRRSLTEVFKAWKCL